MSELRQVRVDRPAIHVLERLAGGFVGGHPLGGRQVRHERVDDEPVAEAVLPDGRRDLVDEAELRRTVERVEDVVATAWRGVLERAERERPAEDGGVRERLDRLAGERLEPAADRVAHAVRERQVGRWILQPALGEQQGEHLAGEERVAFGARVHRQRELGRGPDAAHQLDELGDVLGREPAEHEAPTGADDVRQRGLGVGRALGHALVHRDDEQHRDVAEHP